MKIVIASDSYKGSNTSIKVAEGIERGIRKVKADLECIKIPVADGEEKVWFRLWFRMRTSG